jgi:hypothetical protein
MKAFLVAGLWGAAMLTASGVPAGEPDEIARESVKAFDRLAAGPSPVGRVADSNNLAWGDSYALMAYVAMFEATGEKKHLQFVMDYGDWLIANRDDRQGRRDDVRGRELPAWSTAQYSDGVRAGWVVHCGMITYPVARAAYLVKRDPELRREHGKKTDEHLRAVAEAALAFDPEWRESKDGAEGWYVGPAVGPKVGGQMRDLAGQVLPLNQQNALGRAFLALWLGTGEARFKARAEKLGTYLKRSMKLADGAWQWSYRGRGADGSEDISHAAINADFACALYRAGLIFSAEDLKALAGTFRKFCRPDAGGFSRNIDGSGGEADRNYAPSAGRWGHLGFVDPAVRRTRADGCILFT